MSLDKALLDKCEGSDFHALHTLLQILAHSYTIALAEKKLYGITLEDKLSEEERSNGLEKLSEDIVSEVWPTVNTESLDTVRQGNKVVRDRGKEVIHIPISIVLVISVMI